MPEYQYAAIYGVAIYTPSDGHPCLLCVDALAHEIEIALEGTDERVAHDDPDWRAIVRTGRVNLCAPHQDALREYIAAQG